MELSEILAVFKRRSWILLTGVLVAVACAFLISNSKDAEYQATTTLVIRNQATGAGDTPAADDIVIDQRVIDTYLEFARRPSLLTQVIQRLNLPFTEEQLRSNTTISQIGRSQILLVAVSDTDPTRAAETANALAEVFRLDAAAILGQQGTLLVSDAAAPPSVASGPNTMVILLLAVTIGLLLAGVVALGLDALDNTLETPSDIAEAVGLPTLAVMNHTHHIPFRNGPSTMQNVDSASMEELRDLRTTLQILQEQEDVKSILIASAQRGEGRSRTVLNLGFVLSEGGHQVVVIDADLRKPGLHDLVGISNQAGLANLLATEDEMRWPLARVSRSLLVLPSGPVTSSTADQLSRMREVLDQAVKTFDFIVLDSSAYSAVADAGALARQADATILLVEAGRTTGPELRNLSNGMQQRGARVLGVVLNKSKSRRRPRLYGHAATPEGSAAIAKDVAIRPKGTPVPRRQARPRILAENSESEGGAAASS